ncbi:YHS domain-containing protein [Leifsonia sp. F6_8S_P_1A]|uniref:YHS domain-containing protein n=2 Tax=Microbacteriaceae TaxID=85023 RepID=A0ABT8J2M0_9MICO|nr:YHS domain-containing protein [Leifsonia virtsii]MDN4599331.1 YHS domain-containing protein [Leifsonia virtsii]
MPAGATNLLGTGTGTDDLTECVVMKGATVSKAKAEAAGLFRDHNGQRYWFCCAGCAPKFDANPAAYVAA